jgi:hypothetical protein
MGTARKVLFLVLSIIFLLSIRGSTGYATPVIGPIGFTWPSIDWGYAHGEWWSSGQEASQQPPPGEEIWVEAKIDGAVNATLFWSSDGVTWNKIQMEALESPKIVAKMGSMWWLRISGCNYVGIVPGQAPGSTLRVYIVATADDGSTTTSPTVIQPIGWGYLPGIIGFVIVVAVLAIIIYRYTSKRKRA